MATTKTTKNITILNVNNKIEEELILKRSYALSSPERINIIKSLAVNKSVSMLSKELNIPISSLSRHVDILADAGLIHLYYQPGPKGHAKFCSLATVNYTISFMPFYDLITPPTYSIELPIGLFSHCHVQPPCGMLNTEKLLIPLDNPSYFFSADRIQAECLWFDKGFISYNFPTPPIELIEQLSEITFSFEICSETNYYNNNWPSDITVYINKHEILTFTSPGDFGGRRGKYTPKFWPETSTQFGLLKTITVKNDGAYLDNQFVNKNVTFDDLNLFGGSAIQLTIGIKETAQHKGGINLFGKNFGDYPQAIIMTLTSPSKIIPIAPPTKT